MGYCLMPNHTHLIARPEKIDSLNSAIGEAHRRYSRMINFRPKNSKRPVAEYARHRTRSRLEKR